MNVGQTNLLKIDKDCHVDRKWIQGFSKAARQTLESYGRVVRRIQTCNSRSRGIHVVIKINPPVDAELANFLNLMSLELFGKRTTLSSL